MDLAELTDRIRITELLSAYCDHVDRSDLAALLELFTDDVMLDMGHGAAFSGRARVREVLIDRVGYWTHTSHHSSNVLVSGRTAASARVTSSVYVLHDHPGRNESMQLWGRYDDELVKADGRWRIRVRRLRVAGVTEGVSSPVPDRFERYGRQPLPAGWAAAT